MGTKMKLLEDIAIHTTNGMELIPEGTTISEIWNLDTGEEEIPGQPKEDPRKSEMLRVIDEFTSTLTPEQRMQYANILGAAADAINQGSLVKLRQLAGAAAQRGSMGETKLVSVLRQLAAMGEFLGESFVGAINKLINCITN